MWQPSNLQWWILVIVALFIVGTWPPSDDKSVAMKLVNWAVDPNDELPVLPPQLGLGAGDDMEAVNARDSVVQRYDALYLEGGWTRWRLLLKVADDPFNKSTTRQMLVAVGVLTALLVWRSAGRKASARDR